MAVLLILYIILQVIAMFLWMDSCLNMLLYIAENKKLPIIELTYGNILAFVLTPFGFIAIIILISLLILVLYVIDILKPLLNKKIFK